MDISSYFKQAIEQNASDLHLAAGSIPALRISGELIKLNHGVVENTGARNASDRIEQGSARRRHHQAAA